ncbi:M20 metallopeptidase family protein [Psychrobacillus lasiicapitis]|uniref:Amidohydrolase n=1 Tax=Psychrobacillus lasiicapitis TaxID=1636719 RepID=A0A544T6W6_9BACI|nr:amidohydrolase [Psychrobacillus lasiicapitis]TQR13195.1 amidohydrolase [Psychrobacillus lasiicapitis]GGA33660.1 N-acyl-L-amino acid amidohydrolase [Psychrobacillus lasiicapitis]
MEANAVLQQIEDVYQEVIGWRRHLHQHPELSFQEHTTSQYVYDVLESFGGFELSRPTKTSVVARLKGSNPGKVIALRADMDALPIKEETDLPFASTNDGVMHACGHDGHTAMLLGAAKVLKDNQEDLSGEVVFIFQHAEELPPGGAQEMVAAGVLDGVDQVVGVHLFSTVPTGTINIRYGAVTAASDVFEMTVQGKGGHASTPELTVDPLATGAQIVTGLNHIISRSVAPLESGVVSVTKFKAGGEALNVIPDTVEIGGSVRTLSAEVRQLIKNRIIEVAKGIAKANGADVEVSYTYGYGSVMNDKEVTDRVVGVLEEHFPENKLEWVDPILGGEDFSAFSDEKPACFVFIGAGNVEKGITHPHHHPKFDIDESALKDGLKFHVYTALTLTQNK